MVNILIKAVIFDFGGVVSYNNNIIRLFESKPVRYITSYLLRMILNQMTLNFYEKNITINKDVKRIIVELKKKHYVTALLTNTCKDHAIINQKKCLYNLFKPKIISCYVNMRKPELKIYKLTLKKLTLKPAECLLIENKEKNLKPARKLGMKTILFRNSKQLENDLKEMNVL